MIQGSLLSVHYELAELGTLHLKPPEDCILTLCDSYEHMKNMIFGDQPKFGEIMACIERLEQEIID